MESPVNIRFLHQYKRMHSMKPSEAQRGFCSNRKNTLLDVSCSTHLLSYVLLHFCLSLNMRSTGKII